MSDEMYRHEIVLTPGEVAICEGDTVIRLPDSFVAGGAIQLDVAPIRKAVIVARLRALAIEIEESA